MGFDTVCVLEIQETVVNVKASGAPLTDCGCGVEVDVVVTVVVFVTVLGGRVILTALAVAVAVTVSGGRIMDLVPRSLIRGMTTHIHGSYSQTTDTG